MTCKLDKDCVFGDQQPECERVQICCKEKLAVKDESIDELTKNLTAATEWLIETKLFGLTSIDFVKYMRKQIVWSRKTFGTGRRTKGILEHIRKEIIEVEEHPTDLMEWVDIVTLALDGAWRAGYSPEQIFFAMKSKLNINIGREWNVPDSKNEPVEHVRKPNA